MEPESVNKKSVNQTKFPVLLTLITICVGMFILPMTGFGEYTVG